MKIFLCRHGETDYNVEKRFQGTRETSLNEKGMKQAELASKILGKEEFFRAFCSPRKRARQTCEIILSKHKGTPLDIDERLGEINYGVFEGLTVEEVNEKFPGKWGERVDGKYEFPHENGESYREADEKRAMPFLEELKEKYYSRNILVVTHQGTGRLFLGNTLGFSPDEKMAIDFPNEIVYEIEFRPHKTAVKRINVETGAEKEGLLRRDNK